MLRPVGASCIGYMRSGPSEAAGSILGRPLIWIGVLRCTIEGSFGRRGTTALGTWSPPRNVGRGTLPVGLRGALSDQGGAGSSGSAAPQTGYAPEGAKRRYEAHFVSKLTDADGGNAETDTWLDFARDCSYLSKAEHARLTADCREVGAMLGGMLGNPSPFLLKPTRFAPRSLRF